MKWMFLDRTYQDHKGTFGTLYLKDHDHPPIFTLEKPWKSNIQNISCIPPGTYTCVPHTSERFKNVYRLEEVPGRYGILIHTGNYLHEIKGCILPGRGLDTHNYSTIHSTLAMNVIRGIIGREHFKLKISE